MSERIISKTCRVCKQTKSLTEFYKAPGNKDGYENRCKVCHLKSAKEYSQTEKGRAALLKGSILYSKTMKGKATQKRYKQSEKGKIVTRRSTIKYKQTKAGKTKCKQYRQSEKGRISRNKGANKFRITHPTQRKAQTAVVNAVFKGVLPKANSLQCACGNPAKEYHHHKGYAKEHWLDVIPVCKKCHGKIRLKN